MSILNNPDFFPTPTQVLDEMLFGVEIKGKVILEPSSGKGDIIDYLYKHGAKEVICCESSPELAILSAKKGRLIGSDFLEITSDQISHIDLIVANPPFSQDEKHITYMFDIAPNGCEIISLCNYETYSNDYSRSRKSLNATIKSYGSIVNLGDCFSDAERKTNVNIGLVKLYKPKTESDDEFDGYFDLSEEEEEQENGIIQFDEIRSLVNRYVGAVKMFDSVIAINSEINSLISPISSELGIHFGAVQRNSQYSTITRDSFKKELQKSAWKSVFNKLDMDNYVTKSVLDNINKFVEQQTKVPFTMKNIYKMIHMIVGTHGDRMNKVIVEVFDWLTEHHSENRLVEGWKTNSEYVVNKKFIAPYCGLQTSFHGFPEVRWNSGGKRMDDLMKAMCYITGTKFDKNQSIEFFYHSSGESVESELIKPEQEREEGFSYLENKQVYEINGKRVVDIKVFKFKEDPNYHYKLSSGYGASVVRFKYFGSWYDWGFFKVKVYKKGTMHAEFKDEQTWIKFNQTAAKAKGFQLASKFRGNYRVKKEDIEIYKG